MRNPPDLFVSIEKNFHVTTMFFESSFKDVSPVSGSKIANEDSVLLFPKVQMGIKTRFYFSRTKTR